MEIKALTESEKITMKCVWDLGDGTRLAHILALANEKYGKDWKSQTVSTFLARLVRKGYLENHREGRGFYYQILVPQKDYLDEMAERFAEFWKQENVDVFLAALEKRSAFG